MEATAVISSTTEPGRTGVFGRMSPRTRGWLAAGFAALLAVLGATWLWSANPSYRVLFTNLSDRDGGAIIAQLSQMNIAYRNADGGTILVPADKVYEARLKLASQGLPKGSVVGFEILESQRFGVTQFQEQINYQRGLEGELARSIGALAPVAQARVHLALPKQSAFLRDKQPATASVVLQLHPGKSLDRAQIAGVAHLIAASVPELDSKNVSIVDQQGTLLSTPRENPSGLDATQLDYVGQIEANTIKRIEDILTPIVGPGNVRAQVTAEVDFAQIENMAETYKPNQAAESAAVRSQSSADSSQPGPGTAQGVPGAASNQPPVPPTAPINGQAAALNPAAAAAGNSTRREAVTNYEVDKTVRHTKTGAGQIRRLTAAVVVNHRPGAAPNAPSAPRAEAEMQQIQALVREAMGFSQPRGDSLNVVNAAFTQLEPGPVEPVPLWKQPDVIALGKEGGKALLFLLLTLIVVFGVVRPALRSIGVKPLPPPAPPEPAALPLEPKALPQTSASPLDEIRQLAKSDPATVANVVKSWVAES